MDSSRIVLDNIRYIVRALRISSRATEKKCGLSTAQLFVLRALDGSDGMSVNELATRTLTHQSSVSVVVKRLVDQGLVSKRVSPVDSRRAELSLSKKGKNRLKKAPLLVQERLLAALSDFGVADRERLALLLSRFVKAAGLHEGTPPLLFEDDTKQKRKL